MVVRTMVRTMTLPRIILCVFAVFSHGTQSEAISDEGLRERVRELEAEKDEFCSKSANTADHHAASDQPLKARIRDLEAELAKVKEELGVCKRENVGVSKREVVVDAAGGIDEVYGAAPDASMEHLKIIKSVSIPGELVAKIRSATYYTIAVVFKGEVETAVKLVKRYSQLRVLNDELDIKEIKHLFPQKYLAPDYVRCWRLGGALPLQECVKERIEQLPVWLNAALQYVLDNADESKAQILHTFFTETQAEVNAPEGEEKEEMHKELGKEEEEADERDKESRAWYAGKGGKCAIKLNSSDIRDWVTSPEFLAMEDHCPNFGESFAWWGNVACPGRLADITASINNAASPCKQGKGGLGGIPPVICQDYVLKVAKDEEVDPIYGLLQKMDQLKLPTDKLRTVFSPICRLIKVTHPDETGTKVSHFTIVPNFALKKGIPRTYGFHNTYDMKGNWGYEARFSRPDEKTKKDRNFKQQFPNGIEFQGQSPDDGADLIDLAVEASKILAELHSLDYSVFSDIVAVDSQADIDEIKAAHPKVPLAWGTHRNARTGENQLLVMTFGVMDLFMRQDKIATKDRIGHMIMVTQMGSCAAFDIDPLPSLYYQVRWARIFGYNDPGPGDHAVDKKPIKVFGIDITTAYKCGACYYKGTKYQFKKLATGDPSETQFTYFRSPRQQAMRNDTSCEWTNESDPENTKQRL